jgi:hypothetical protein
MKRLAALLIALLLVLGCLALYRATNQRWLVDDGFDLGTYLDSTEPHRRVWMHVLYLPLGRLVASAGAGPGPYQVLATLSAWAGALGIGALWLALRANGARAPLAFALALIAAVTPVVWFYSTTVEVHAVHFAFASIAVCAVLLVPPARARQACLSRQSRLPAGGVLISLDPSCQPVDLYRPHLRELNASRRATLAHGVDARALGELLATETFEQCNALGGAVAIDPSFLQRAAGLPRFEEFALSFWESVNARFGREPSEPPAEGFLVLRAAREPRALRRASAVLLRFAAEPLSGATALRGGAAQR